MPTPPNGTGSRMSPEARREQLLEVGASLFGDSAYEEVWIEEVARRAGISRGLLYHYFPTKRDYFVAVLEYNGARMRIDPDPEPGVPVEVQLRSGVRRFLTQISADSSAFRTAHRQRYVDPVVGEIIGSSLHEQERRILGRVMVAVGGTGDDAPEPVQLAVHGWLSYVNAIVLVWLDTGATALEDMVEMLAGTLESALHQAFAVVGRQQAERAQDDAAAALPADAGALG